jgi:hypothetical protein
MVSEAAYENQVKVYLKLNGGQHHIAAIGDQCPWEPAAGKHRGYAKFFLARPNVFSFNPQTGIVSLKAVTLDEIERKMSAVNISNHYSCDVCSIPRMDNEGQFREHVAGRRHQNALKALNATRRGSDGSHADEPRAPWGCALCGIQRMNTIQQHREHMAGRAHKKALRGASANTTPDDSEDYDAPTSTWGCVLCGVQTMTSAGHKEHVAGKRHQASKMLSRRERPTMPKMPKRDPRWGCPTCSIDAMESEEKLREHLNSKFHATQYRKKHVGDFADKMEEALNNLEQMNSWLVKLGREPEADIAAARYELKKIHINIFDLLENDPPGPVFDTVWSLAEYTFGEEKIFPKEAAKADGALKPFLRTLRHPEFYD